MSDKNFPEVVKEIHDKDDRFGKGAYFFIREALDHTLKSMEKDRGKNKGHVSGRELLEGIRDYALDRFGPMALTLMDYWNIKKCRDFGDIVFKLVDYGILGRTEDDSLADFEEGYNFKEAFEKPFRPAPASNSTPGTSELN